MDSETKLEEYFSPDIFSVGIISKDVSMDNSKGFPKCFHIRKGFKAFQSSRNCFKYSEKQISFNHGNLYNLHLLSNSAPAKTVAFYTKEDFLFHIDTTLMIEALPNRKSLVFEYLKSGQMR